MKNLTNKLLQEVKQNKKYSSLADEIVLEDINNYLKKNKITKITKQDVKEIRANLHKVYSSFQTKKKNKIDKYIEELKKACNVSSNLSDNQLINITNKLLSITLSTKERINDYPEIYKKIFSITGRPKTIIDLGAGFNLFSYPLMNIKELTYYSYDINEQDVNYLNEYIRIMKSQGLNGKAEILDMNNKNLISALPFSDLVLLLKIIDIIDKQNHKPSEELIKMLINKTKYIIASFATTTITRKSMNNPNRKWFELMLERNNFKFSSFKTDNEIFYVINK